MDTAPSREVIQNFIDTSLTVEGVVAIDKCFARKMGFEYYIDMHVIVDGNISVYQGHEISHKVKEKLMETFPAISNVLIHIEPATEERLKRSHVIQQTDKLK